MQDGRNATLVANLVGVGLATTFIVLMQRRGNENLRHFLLPGFCAGLTTFSAVAGLTLEPNQGGVFFLFQNVVLSLVIVALVLPIARKVIPVRS